MRYLVLVFILIVSLPVSASEPFHTERSIIELSKSLNDEVLFMQEYKGLKSFCNDVSQRKIIFGLMDQIHHYHAQLDQNLRTTTYGHSQQTIKRILRHIKKVEEKYKPEVFTEFLREQCAFQSELEKESKRYQAGFASHSYSSKVYAQEVEMYRYIKRLTRRIDRVKGEVERFYNRRMIWEY